MSEEDPQICNSIEDTPTPAITKEEADRIAYEHILDSILAKINKKIANTYNENLFPIHMGPHYVYTIDHPLEVPDVINIDDTLEETLTALWNKEDLSGMKEKGAKKVKRRRNQRRGRKQEQQFSDKDQSDYSQSEEDPETPMLKITRNIKSRDAHEGKYKKYTVEFKIKIVNEVRQLMANDQKKTRSISFYIHRKATEYGIPPKNIYRWFLCDDISIKESGRKAKFPELEKKLLKHMMKYPWKKRRDLLDEARSIMSEMGEGYDDFSFSKGWFERFKRRHKIGKLSSFSKKMSNLSDAELETAEKQIESANPQDFSARGLSIAEILGELHQEQ